MPHNRIRGFIDHTAWAILPEKLEAICHMVGRHGAGDADVIRQAAERVAAERQAADNARPKPNAPGSIAVINVFGVIVPRASMFTEFSGGVSCEQIAARLREAEANPDIKAIVLNVDSPGGAVSGVPELAAVIFNLNKYVVAVANGTAASAAYWLASQADELVVTPSGEVGSIGVVAVHEDWTEAYAKAGIKPTIIRTPKYKYEGSEVEPLSPEAHAHMQGQIDEFYDMFTRDVGRGRGVGKSVVRGEAWGMGRMVMAKAAVDAGMADKVATLPDVVAQLGGSQIGSNPRAVRQARADNAQNEPDAPAIDLMGMLEVEKVRAEMA